MEIRQATPNDIGRVKEIFDSLQVTRDMPGWRFSSTGFFEYSKSEEALRALLNPYFVVAESGRDIRGFSISYNDKFFNEYYAGSTDCGIRLIQSDFKTDFLYLSTLGVLNPDNPDSRGIANNLTDWSVDRARADGLKNIVAFTCEEPFRNHRMIGFLDKKEFGRFGSVQPGNDILLGAYELVL
jgi:hypothetical protein